MKAKTGTRTARRTIHALDLMLLLALALSMTSLFVLWSLSPLLPTHSLMRRQHMRVHPQPRDRISRMPFSQPPVPTGSCSPIAVNLSSLLPLPETADASLIALYKALSDKWGHLPPPPEFRGDHQKLCDLENHKKRQWSYCLPIRGLTRGPKCGSSSDWSWRTLVELAASGQVMDEAAEAEVEAFPDESVYEEEEEDHAWGGIDNEEEEEEEEEEEPGPDPIMYGGQEWYEDEDLEAAMLQDYDGDERESFMDDNDYPYWFEDTDEEAEIHSNDYGGEEDAYMDEYRGEDEFDDRDQEMTVYRDYDEEDEDPYQPDDVIYSDEVGIRSPCVFSSVLHLLMVEVFDTLRSHGLQPALLFGSMLGAVRDESVIPFTEDADVGFRKNLKKKLVMKRVKDELLSRGYHMFKDSIYRVCVAPSHPLAGFLYDHSVSRRRMHRVPYVDLYAMTPEDDEERWKIDQMHSSWYRIERRDFEPYRKVQVNGVEFDTLANPHAFLVEEYGRDYLTPKPRS